MSKTHCHLTDLNGEPILIPWSLLAACTVQRITSPDCTVIMDHKQWSARVRESVSDIAAAMGPPMLVATYDAD